MRRTKILTLSAALTALIVVLLYLGSLIEVLDLVTVFAASLFLAFSVIEFGGAWPWLVYGASAVLAVLLVPNKFVAWEYALVVGLLPILKGYFERLPRLLCTILKFVSFNLLFSGVICLFYFFFDLRFEPVTVFSVTIPAYALPAGLAITGNLCFLLYDILLTRLVTLYYRKYRDRVKRWLR